jgi:hypothetical protein
MYYWGAEGRCNGRKPATLGAIQGRLPSIGR